MSRLAMPGLVLKAEAIVGPDMLVQYLGGHDHFHPECDLAYDNQLMVMVWSALAARDARLAAQALGRRRANPVGTTWVTYVRGHDDIGWAVSDEDAWPPARTPSAIDASSRTSMPENTPGRSRAAAGSRATR